MTQSESGRFSSGILGSVTKHRLGLVVFFLAFGIRLVPELLSWPDPLGFDTVTWLAPFMGTCQEEGLGYGYSLLIERQSAPLAFMLFGFVAFVTNVDPLILTKIMAPFLFGFLVWSFFYFVKKTFGWDEKKAFLASVVLSLYFIPLRMSWDLYRNLLGIAFLMIALAHSTKLDTKRDQAVFLVFSFLAILTHELIAVFVIFLCAYLFLCKYLKKKEVSPPLLVCATVAAVFVLYYAHWVIPASGATVLSSRPVLPLEFPMDYLSAIGPYSYAGPGEIYADVLILALLAFIPIFPLCVKGFFWNRLLNGWVVLLLFGSFTVLFLPTMAIPLWHRWLFMLIFPAVIFGTNFLSRLDKKKISLYLVLLVILSSLFIALPSQTASHYFATPYTVRYVPSSMMQNTVPLSDSDDVRSALGWLDENAGSDSTLLAHYAFVGWAQLYTDDLEIVTYFTIDEVEGFDLGGSSHVYTIWWERGTGWYQDQAPSQDFNEIHQSGRIVIYERPA